MRTILVLLVAIASGCEPSGLSASWNEAEVVSSDRTIAIHALMPMAIVRANVVNQTDSAATFFLGGRAGYGIFDGAEAEDPGRFLLVGPDTTLSMAARMWERGSPFGQPRERSVAGGDTMRLVLYTDSRWLLPFPTEPDSPLAPADSASAAQFFNRALRDGRIVYVSESRDTLAIERARKATIHFRAEDQPSALD